MSNVDKLLALGAYSCGGDLIWKNKVMGHMRDGDFVLTEEGKAVLAMDIEDVEVKQDKPKRGRKPSLSEPEIELDVSDSV
jgi:hypothetical protein